VALGCDATAGQGAPGATCTLTVTGAVGADECLSCDTTIGITPLVREDFTGCPDLAARGWTVAGVPACPTDPGLPPDPLDGSDALRAERAAFTLTRRVDTTGLDRVRLCFDLADRGAGADDSVEVRIDTDGTFDVVFQDTAGPIDGVDDAWVTTCLDLTDLDPAAAENADLGIALAVDAAGAGGDLYLDGIALDGWTDGTVTPATVSSTDFSGCDLVGWTASGDPIACPVAAGALAGRDALAATGASWSLAGTVDGTAVCEDLVASFQLAGEGALAADTATLTFDRGAGPVTAWGSVGQPDAAGTLRQIVVNLSHRDADLRFTPVVDLSLALAASSPGATLVLDDVTVTGSTCAPGTDVVTAEAPARVAAGTYDVAVTSTARTRAYVSCAWDGRPTSSGRAAIDFSP
jgi:hypothetical protein